MEKIKKHFVRIFKTNDFLIFIKCNMKIVNYLDVALDLNGNSFRPYSKCDNELSYINCDSNHPPCVVKRLPRTVELRLSSTSSNELIFKNAPLPYEEALKKSGYKCKLNYQPQVAMTKNTKRKRNIIWFNPPFSQSMETKIGNRLLALVDLHIPVNHKLHKILNRNSIKVSYSCMRNVKSIINRTTTRFYKAKEAYQQNPAIVSPKPLVHKTTNVC